MYSTRHWRRPLINGPLQGTIIYVSSVAASRPCAEFASYCASKAALDQLARVVALEEAPNGVRVNVLSPGMVVTESHSRRQGGAR